MTNPPSKPGAPAAKRRTPAVDAAGDGTKEKSRPAVPARRRVFRVDDHPLVREWLASLIALEPDLEICGQAEDAQAALAAVAPARPDVVVVDLTLPRSSGVELIKDLRAQFPTLRILVLSMHDEVSVAERAFRAGANGYAIKREEAPRIVEALRAVLAGKFYASSTLTAELAGRLFGGPASGSGRPEDELSDREMEVFRQRGRGRNTKEIAAFLRVSVKTVGSYEARIRAKLGLESSAAFLRAAVRWNDQQEGL
jgi:DNA-binding NarL/FixJ family response regulator